MIIYRITNTITTKSYIGQTIQTLKKRWKQHCYNYGKTHFYNAIKKYGKDCWTLETLEEVDDINLLNDREIYWISYYDTFNNGYNSTVGGLQGTIVSEETKEKQSISAKNKLPMTDQHKHKISLSLLGRTSPWKGKKLSEEHKNKMSKSRSGDKSSRSGIKLTSEHKEKLLQANLGKICSNETRDKMSQSRKGKLWYNNGIKEIKSLVVPEGFLKGRLIKSS